MEIDRETVETVTDLILGGSKITVDGDCSHEIKRHLLLGRKTVKNTETYFSDKGLSSKSSGSFQWS